MLLYPSSTMARTFSSVARLPLRRVTLPNKERSDGADFRRSESMLWQPAQVTKSSLPFAASPAAIAVATTRSPATKSRILLLLRRGRRRDGEASSGTAGFRLPETSQPKCRFSLVSRLFDPVADFNVAGQERAGYLARRFSYHFNFVESMHAMSGRLSPLRSTTVHAAAPIPPLSSTCFDHRSPAASSA